ncbi:MAG: N-6 DNA methylase [archaeon]
MSDKEKAKEEVGRLVEKFESYPKSQIDSMPEEDIKFQFIEPLFEALGWKREEISKETRILKGRADYILRIGNQEKLVIEAKKTSVHLLEEEGRQAVSYAYHRKIKFAVLTNFKHLRVYHALSNVKLIDRNLLKKDGAYFILEAKDFVEKFDLLWLLSRESFENREIDKLLSAKDEKINKPIDENILNDLLNIRGWLSKELKAKKNYLSQEVIDEVVQILIDRLIFIRSVEDRGLEPMNFLKSLESNVRQQVVRFQLFPYLLEQFEEFNKKYDSKLFEKGLLEKEGAFSDEVLRKVIVALYFGSEGNQERYLFDQIPGDLFGGIYEQYLGTILAGTEKRVKLDSSSGKRKKMGIYYTPAYIVDYIVKNTVYEYIKDKTIDEILEVNILDPACGSGSFITRAFVEVCNVIEDKLNNGEEGSKTLFKNSGKKIDKLNLGQKIEILRNCVYGVDLDEKAVELARLNLLLKLLDEETQETRKMLLPHLENNIKCGNSLIDDAKVSDRAFNWKAQFPDVFKSGGFDVVVGNPPYVRVQEINPKEVKWLNKKYDVAKGYIDTYMLFTELSLKIMREKGLFSFIMPSKFMSANYGESLREFILNNSTINKIVDFGDLPVFESAITYPGIYVLRKSKEDKMSKLVYIKISDLKKASFGEIDIQNSIIYSQAKLEGKTWNFGSENNSNLLEKLDKVDLKLEDVCEKIFQGLITSADKVFIIHEKEGKFFSDEENGYIEIERKILKKLVKGLEIKKYKSLTSQRHLIFPYILKENKYTLISERELEKEFPKCYKYLTKHKSLLKDRTDVKENKISWYAFSRPQNLEEFEKEKILTPFNAFSNSFTIDKTREWFFTAGVAGGYGLKVKNEYNKEILLGILNSKLSEFFIKKTSTFLRGGYYSYENRFIKNLPIRLPPSAQEKKIISLVEQMLELQKKYHDEKIAGGEKERLKQQIDNIDYEINEEVYKLYGITDEEKGVIEESLR